MLAWLESELSELEKVDGAAILIAHVPNINECLRTYGRRFHAIDAIVDRYQNVTLTKFEIIKDIFITENLKRQIKIRW